MRWLLVIVMVAATRHAHADEVDDLVARGEALAKQGEFTGAIEVFKEADAKRPRAAHACLIGLVYTRRELWPQAELFFARCRARATPEDPLPTWMGNAQQQLAAKLAADGAAAVTIAIAPATAPARITVSSFAPDESFEPSTIHLAPGRHVLRVTADGYLAASREIVVESSTPQTVSIELRSVAEAAAAAAAEAAAAKARAAPPPPVPHVERSAVPSIVMLSGAGLALVGGAVELFVYKPARDRLATAPDVALYDARVASFRDRRDLTIGLYAAAAAAVATGLVLRYTVFAPVTVSAEPERGGAVVTIGWGAMTAPATPDRGDRYCPTCERTFDEGDYCTQDATRLVRLSTRDPMLGLVLDGRYTLTTKLGDGGMGAVYRATQHSVGRDVAIKLMAPSVVGDPQVIKRFLREAKLASRLSHPNAVAVLDFGQSDTGMFFLVMELVEGRSLEQVLEDDPVLPLPRIVRIASQICDALEGAHALQIVHRDLKPANVMLLSGKRDLVKVLDFGIAKSLAANETKMTHTGSALGTPAFMPPEVAIGAELDTRADLYSLGCLLYLMATGNLPFIANTIPELMMMHRDQPPQPMYGIQPAFAAVVMRLLEKSPARRFETAGATREALEACVITTGNAPVLPASLEVNEPTAIHAAPSPPVAPSVAMITPAPALAAITAATGPIASGPPSLPELPAVAPRRRTGVVVVASLAALAVGVGVFVAVQRSEQTAASPPPATHVRAAVIAPDDAAPAPDATVATAIEDAPAAPVAEALPIDAGGPVRSHAPPRTHAPGPGSAATAPKPDAGDETPF